MQSIEEKAIQTYQENLKYLEEFHKDVFSKIDLLNLLIENGTYEERYILEYRDEGYFDILELSSNEYLYKTNSVEHAKNMVDFNTLARVGGLFKAHKHIYVADHHAEFIDKSELSFHNSLWATAKIINYTAKYTQPDSLMQRVNKIIFIEIGLGLHLQGIIDKLKSRVVFIKEPNLEIFRLSLFVTNYKEMAKNCNLHFSITDDEMKERDVFLQFLDEGNNYNLIMKHIPFNDDYGLQTQRLQSHVISQSYINYGYSAILLRYINSPRYLVQGYTYLNVNNRYRDNALSNKPVLLLFSGPSTFKNLEWVQANHHRFIIFSALSTCRMLNSINIAPDFVIHIDPDERSNLLFEDLDKDYFQNTIAILASNTDEETVARFQKKQIYFVEQGSDYKKGFGKLSSPSVGEYTYGLSIILGATNIFTLGIDLALDSKTLATHGGGFHPFQSNAEENDKSASLSLQKSTVYVKGNFSEIVPTIVPYKMSIEQLNIFTEVLKKDYHHLHNLSDGAYFEGFEPVKVDEYDWNQLEKLDKNTSMEEIRKFFDGISSSEFRDEDKALIEYQIKQAKILEKTIKLHSKKKITNPGEYLHSLAKLTWNLSDMDYKTHSDLAQVYYEYLPIVYSYIFDLFNTQNLENETLIVKEVDALLVEQLRKMSSLYTSKLKSYLK